MLDSLAAALEDRKLLDPQALAECMDRAHILDIRPVIGAGSYSEGHVPGAICAPYPLWLGDDDNPGAPLSDDALTMLARMFGVIPSKHTVIVHRGETPGDFAGAARVYWTLKSAGVRKISILDGGVKAWAAAGLALTETPSLPNPTKIYASMSRTWLADRDEVQAVIAGEAKAALIDTRAIEYLRGEAAHPAQEEPGTLPGAIQSLHADWFEAGARPLPADKAATVWTGPEGPAILFCSTGHLASTNWFMMSEVLGLPEVKLYPEGMVGWTGEDLPAVTI